MTIRRQILSLEAQDIDHIVDQAMRLSIAEDTGRGGFSRATALLIAAVGAVQEDCAARIKTPQQAFYVLYNLASAREAVCGILDRLEEQVRAKGVMLQD